MRAPNHDIPGVPQPRSALRPRCAEIFRQLPEIILLSDKNLSPPHPSLLQRYLFVVLVLGFVFFLIVSCCGFLLWIIF